jgi:6-phosphogluconate dehydrogenase
MAERDYHLGLVGLGVMGRNLLLNMADHGYPVAGYDKDPERVRALLQEAESRPIGGATDHQEFIAMLRPPRAVMMLVPAGPAVDAVIRDLLPHLSRGDLVIDGGNSFFRDTDLRGRALAEHGIAFLGVGVSGGEHGARHGPSMMPGGPRDAYERVRPLFEAIAARAGDDPCVAYLGPGACGHYVKMVHNGIEYALMQLIAETYDLLRRGLGFSDDALHETYAAWNATELAGYLLEITADIFLRVDERTGRRLVDVILDAAKQKGTGMWTSQNAMELGQPVPTISAAVEMRELSGLDSERAAASRILRGAAPAIQAERGGFVTQLRNALYAGMIVAYAQGMALLRAASQAYGYGLDLEAVARIWRGGCIIRAALLERLRGAYRARPDLPNLLVDPQLAEDVLARAADLRTIVCRAATAGIPAPAFSASLAYLDGYRSAWLPANLTQAQRDYFGAHTYERVDARGVFHTEWSREQ